MHRVVRSTIVRHSGERYEPGDLIEPSEAELNAFGDNLEIVESEPDGDDSPDRVGEMDTYPDESDDLEMEICGVQMTDESICQRPANECPYHED